MSLPVDPRIAFQQGYMRAAYKTMDLMNTALRQRWDAAKIEAALRRAVSEKILESETEAFIEHYVMSKHKEGAPHVVAR